MSPPQCLGLAKEVLSRQFLCSLVFTGKQESFSRWKQDDVIYSRRYGFDAVFTRANECQDVNVGDPDCPMERLRDEFGVDIVISHLNAWQFLSSALKSEKRPGHYFSGKFLGRRLAFFG